MNTREYKEMQVAEIEKQYGKLPSEDLKIYYKVKCNEMLSFM